MRTGFEFYSSKRISLSSGSFEVNRRMVLAAREMGCGHAALDVSLCKLHVCNLLYTKIMHVKSHVIKQLIFMSCYYNKCVIKITQQFIVT